MKENTMPDSKKPRMIGFENLLNMSNKDRAQAVWDKAMWPEAKDHIERYMAFKAGLGPNPGKYTGRVIDFEKAAEELEEEEPEWTSRSEDLWQERQREREAQGLEREPHPLGDDYE
jgi:hypothetical protein